MKPLTLKRLLVLASFLTMGAAAFVTPMPEADPNWANTVVAVASIGYLISLLLIAFDVAAGALPLYTEHPDLANWNACCKLSLWRTKCGV